MNQTISVLKSKMKPVVKKLMEDQIKQAKIIL